jgi:hypothetical protein
VRFSFEIFPKDVEAKVLDRGTGKAPVSFLPCRLE